MTIEEVLARSRMLTPSAMIVTKRLKWFGHVLKINDDYLVIRVFTWEPTENYSFAKRTPRVQRNTGLDQLEEDCSRKNMS